VAGRFSAQLVVKSKRFVLNVPVAGHESLVKAIGACSGRDGNKFEKLGIETCAVGWLETKLNAGSSVINDSKNIDNKNKNTNTETKADNDDAPQLNKAAVEITTQQPDANNARHRDKPKSKTKKKRDAEEALLKRSAEMQDIALPFCCAHLVCVLDKVLDNEVGGHLLLLGHVEIAFVRSNYWNGTNFISSIEP
jgi:flavin reductase (DIM6/NTAB) family NADH-FMN oxidoreductase RutF